MMDRLCHEDHEDAPAEPEPAPVTVVATTEETKQENDSEPIDTGLPEGAHTASAEEIDYSGVLERGTKENCWSMKLKPGVPASTFEQQSLYGPFDIEKCLAWCLDPPYGPPRVAIIRHVSFCLLAGGQAVYDGLTQVQTVLGIIAALIASMAVDQMSDPLNCDYSLDDPIDGHPDVTKDLCEMQGICSSLSFLLSAITTLTTVIMYSNLMQMHYDEMAYFVWRDAPLLFGIPAFTLVGSVITLGLGLRVRVKASYNDSTLIGYNCGSMALLLIVGGVARRMFVDVHSMRLARIARTKEAVVARDRRVQRSKSKARLL